MTAAVGADYSTRAVHLTAVGPRAVVSHQIVDCKVETRALLHHLIEALKNVGGFTYPAPPPALYLERPWMRAEKGAQTAIAIHRIAYFVEACAYLAGYVRVELVPVPTWRSSVFGHQPKSADAKRMSIAYVERVFKITTRDDNLADSICLGAYGQSQEAIRSRMPA